MTDGLETFDVVIIGAGPAGLAAATNAAIQNLKHIVFEKSELANTIFEYQLGKYVMAEPANLPLRTQLEFEAGYREDLLSSWKTSIEKFNVNIRYAEVTEISKSNDIFFVNIGNEQIAAKSVVLGIGVQGSPRTLGVVGENSKTVAYTLADPRAFQDEDIIVVGAGDAAIENAIALSEFNRVIIINRSGEFPRAKDSNARAIQDAINKGKIKCFYNATVEEISDNKIISINTPDGVVKNACDRVIARLGAVPPKKFLESLGIVGAGSSTNAFPKVDNKYQTIVQGMYAIGAIIGYPLIKHAMNQGYEVIEHILGNEVEPADQVLIVNKLAPLGLDVEAALKTVMDTLPLFNTLTVPEYRELIAESTVKKFQNNEVIFAENDYTDSFFSIISGEIEIELPNSKNVVLGKGNFFGEMSLLSGRRRSATVRAKDGCVLLETPRRQILKLIRTSEDVCKSIDELFVLRALETSVFKGASRNSLKALLPKLKSKNFKKGEVVFREGDVGDALYIIKKGSIQISRKILNGEDVPQSYIPAGNYFGEMALIGDSPGLRSATVKAAVACETLVLDREFVSEFLSENPVIAASVNEVVARRKLENLLDETSTTQGALLGFAFGEGLTDADNILIIDSDLCVGCDNCEKACASTHEGNSRLDRKGGKSFASIQIPISCRHCENPLCMLDCPPDAIKRKADGEVIIDDSCIGCENCTRNCPYGVIKMVYEKKASPLTRIFELLGISQTESKSKSAKATKCDMCEDLEMGPACVRACPTGAAIRTNPKSIMDLIDLSK